MSAITATFEIQDDAPRVVMDLLKQFPKGSRVRLAISQEIPAESMPDLDEYRRMVALARQQTPPSPWASTTEAMKVLREGEED
jgi:hypothetical protein